MFDLTAFQRDVLVVASGLDDPHGLAIKKELDKYYETEINHGRLYPNLDSLVQKGLLIKGQKDNRTNEYQISRRGSEVLKTYREWIRSASGVESEFLDGDEGEAPDKPPEA